MSYQIHATSLPNQDAEIQVKESRIAFGTTKQTAETLPSPAEIFLSSFAACMLKNVERFSGMMKFSYEKTTLEVSATRLENPPRMENIEYNLTIFSNDPKLNVRLLKTNIERFGTIYNTIKLSCAISGTIQTKIDV